MTASAECPITARFIRVAILSGLLIGLAHLVAEDGARYAAIGGPAPGHTLTHYRVIFTIWATAILLTPALCFFILFKPGVVEDSWRSFWTFSYVAFLSHLYWTVIATFHGNLWEIFHSQSGVATNPERIVEQPGLDSVLALWWGLDVALLWLVRRDVRWIRLQRGAVHLVAFTMFVGALTAPKASRVAHLLGMVMATTVVSTYLARLVFRQPDSRSLSVFLYVMLFRFVNRLVIWRRLVWHRMPLLLAIGNLDALREVLRAKNLHNTSDIPVSRPQGLRPAMPYDPVYLYSRDLDGMYNDLAKPDMGSASLNPANPADTSNFTQSSPGARFGRNIPLSEVDPRRHPPLLEPNPWEVSNALLARPAGRFVPAESLNLLAAAWIQFQVHDWFNHGTPERGKEIEVQTTPGHKPHGCPMLIRRTRPDPTRVENDGNGPTTYVNAESHWWDGSQIYGSSEEAVVRCRAGKDGKLDLGTDGLLVMEQNGLEKTGLSANWWLGLSLMHNLFAKEHNAICDHLKREYPGWDDDQLYRTARLVNVALMAKIHTVEWTPAILGHPALQLGMKGNWWGFASERIKKVLRRISESELVSGIPGSVTDHHGADYCLTEEFVSVYRMHALMPDEIKVHAATNGKELETFILGSETDGDRLDVVGPGTRTRALAVGTMADLFYSFGIANPGALVLHNYPEWMRRLQRRHNDGTLDEVIDLAAIDIVRDRERGVPRYNRFRELFHMRRVKSFEELTSDSEWAKELEKVYGDVDMVDLMVGMYAEDKPRGFGISDTAFRVFILMASRRLKSDRFFTTDYTPEIYSRAGLDWVENHGMRTVLLRHYPVLAPALYHAANPFSPWRRVEETPVS
jgi:hypothetical protein